MSALQADVNYRSVAVTAATLITVVGVRAPTNQAVKILEAAVSFDGATSSNAPAIVDLVRCTFATNAPGTSSTSTTPTKRDSARPETIQSTAAHTWTAEPTVKTTTRSILVAQFDGLKCRPLPR